MKIIIEMCCNLLFIHMTEIEFNSVEKKKKLKKKISRLTNLISLLQQTDIF